MVHETGLLYTEIVAATLELYTPTTDKSFTIIRDQRSLKGVSLSRFNEMIKVSLLPRLPANVDFHIHAANSVSNAPIQIADWICGALARYHENKPEGEAFYLSLKITSLSNKSSFLITGQNAGKNKKGLAMQVFFIRAAMLTYGCPRLKSSVPLGNI